VEEGTSALPLNSEEDKLHQFHFHAQSAPTIGGAW
jgi:hypothetical protein